MPSEKEDLVRGFLEEAWANQDRSAALAYIHPEIEIDWSTSVGPAKDIYRGHEGLVRFWESLWEAWDEFAPNIEESIERGRDQLITANLIRARGKASGIEVTSRGAILWTFRDGKIAGARLFQSRDEALEADPSEDAPAAAPLRDEQ
jgi:ketosteroid isomerase-like protein